MTFGSHSYPVQTAAKIGGLTLALLLGCGDSSICGEGSEEQDGSCVPICIEPCGPHQECVETDNEAECACAAGYEGDPCVWSGSVQDPEFTSQEVWSEATNGAVVLPLAMGLEAPGIAAFESSVVCNAGAVSQVVEMPSYELAEPFVIEMTYRSNDTNGVAIGYGRAFRRVPATYGAWETRRVCMGEAGYGGPVKFQVAASERTPDCFAAPIGTIEVDRIQVLVAEAGECPARGTVLNGEANQGEGGWFFDEPDPVLLSIGLAEGRLEPGVGKSGSSGARIYKEAGGNNRAAMGTKISVPVKQTMPSPALRFWWRATEGQHFRIELGTFETVAESVSQLDTLVSDGAEDTYTYCLPPWTHGNIIELAFVQERTDDFVEEESELVVDEVELISDLKCGDSEDLLDPSFDSAPNRWPHARQVGAPGNSVRLLNDAQLAHPPGEGVLALNYENNQALVAMGARLWVPLSVGDNGPQLVFYSNVPSDAGGIVRWSLGLSAVVTAELLPGGGWRRNEVCLPPEWAERWFRFGVGVTNFVEPLVTFDPPKQVFLDDFELTTDESCPAR